MSSTVPTDVARAAAQQMLATIYSQRAQFEVQQITNGHSLEDVAGANGLTYGDRYTELREAEERLRANEDYGSLLPK